MIAGAPARDEPLRQVWHGGPGELARALIEAEGGTERRLHVFDIPPRLVRGLFAASFVWGRAIHRCLIPYYDRAALDRERASLETAARRLRVRVVDGRVEIGAGTGDALHYFLPRDEEPGHGKRAEFWRRRTYAQWLAAAREAAPGSALRLVSEGEEGAVVAAGGEGAHYLIRLDGKDGRTLQGVLRRLRRGAAEDLAQDSDLYRDIMGEWAG